MQLNSFETIIDTRILSRGYNYFREGRVVEFEQKRNNEFEAVVLGTDAYVVEVVLRRNTVVRHVCGCPYDLGPVCKHVVAVLYELEQTLDEFSVGTAEEADELVTENTIEEKLSLEQIKEILDDVPKKELVAYILKHTEKDRKFRYDLLNSFGNSKGLTSRDFFENQINTIIESQDNDHGFIFQNGIRNVANDVNPLLDQATNALNEGNLELAFNIGTAVLNETIGLINYSDDSYGYLGNIMNSAMELVREISQKTLDEDLRRKLIEYGINSFLKKTFDGWEWHFDILEVAAKVVDNSQHGEKILNALKNSDYQDYHINRATEVQLEVIKRTQSQEIVSEFIRKNIAIVPIRRYFVKELIDSEDYAEALKILKDGIRHDSELHKGAVIEWYNWMLKIAQIQKDRSAIIEYARILFLKNNRSDQDYYQLFKTEIASENWKDFVENLIRDVQKKPSWEANELLRDIYIREKYWDELLALTEQSLSFESIKENEPYLKQEFTPELIDLYSRAITDYLVPNVGRNHYQTVCYYIQRMQLLGGRKNALQLINQLKNDYPRRRALLEELDKL